MLMTFAELKACYGVCECKQCAYTKQKPPKPTKKPMRRFVMFGTGKHGGIAKALNRSDARSQFKSMFGLRRTAKLGVEELKQ